MNDTQIFYFWEAYENGANNCHAIVCHIRDVYGLGENFESFLDKVEEYAKVNLTWSLPRDGVPY